MNKLTSERRASILSALCEGMSVNATARMVGVSKVTVLRLLSDAGQYCADYHDLTVRGVKAGRIEADEMWSFCGCKARAKANGSKGYGDAWVWVGMDSDTKLVLGYVVGQRDSKHALHLMRDIAGRVEGRPQVTTDGFNVYRWTVDVAFGHEVDHAVVQKHYATTSYPNGRYSPPQCVSCEKRVALNNPDLDSATTSYVERQNLSLRMGSRRFTRLTNGFSKRFENHEHAVALHYFHYNFVRKHATLKTTPAVAAGIATKALTMLDLVHMIERDEQLTGGRLTDYLPATPTAA